MKKPKSSAITIGLDLGDRKHAVCVLDAKGEILKQETITNIRGSLTALSRRYPGSPQPHLQIRHRGPDVPCCPGRNHPGGGARAGLHPAHFWGGVGTAELALHTQ